MATTSSTQAANGSADHHAMRIYELEATVTQLRDAHARSQTSASRMEKERERAIDELETLNKAYSRLEARVFESETQLGTASSKLERTQRNNATLQSTLEARVASLERERETMRKKEAELVSDLAAAKRRATLQRRQTVSSTSAHSRSGSTAGTTAFGRMSMFAHDMPVPTPFASPTYQAEPLADASEDSQKKIEEMRTHIQQLNRKLGEAENRTQQAIDQAARIHADAEHALGAFDVHRQRISDLETTVAQLTELNESLREDNESYQMLLQMSTMKGGLTFGNSARMSLDSRSSSGKWAASPGVADDGDLPEGSSGFNYPLSPDIGLDLASELGQALSLDEAHAEGLSITGDLAPDADARSPAIRSRISGLEEQVTQLKEELRKTKYDRRHLGDENKAMTLYINKILGRIMASPNGLEAILSSDYDKKSSSSSSSAKPKQLSPFKPHATKIVRKEDASMPASATVRVAPSQHRPSLSLAAQGSGDGITSVFIPPTSPTALRVNKPLPPSAAQQQQQQKDEDVDKEQQYVPPPYTRRVRSATVAVGATPDIKLVNKAAGAATISNGSSGTWWKRMSVLRLGSSWSAQEEESAN
ncbi:hypothetical protein GGH99_002626 [Coemansia sp. RSA 1285]|nr:hypothetical protein EV177_006260 [Coemansia sp. RSA 1804]KAJ2690431.1 hypothetical protein GGH99_002626 [Coemansia sp. RSA 1285]